MENARLENEGSNNKPRRHFVLPVSFPQPRLVSHFIARQHELSILLCHFCLSVTLWYCV